MAIQGPIYEEKYQVGDIGLLNQLKEAVVELEAQMQAIAPVSRCGNVVGWGVNKVHRGIAADSVISITKAIKSLKGW